MNAPEEGSLEGTYLAFFSTPGWSGLIERCKLRKMELDTWGPQSSRFSLFWAERGRREALTFWSPPAPILGHIAAVANVSI